jgi:hypothetical protein
MNNRTFNLRKVGGWMGGCGWLGGWVAGWLGGWVAGWVGGLAGLAACGWLAWLADLPSKLRKLPLKLR